MIPYRLRIQGLYSYQESQEIDFSRLTAAELFGIFGATGSGKSSILEAITLALFGKSERLGGDNANYNMLNLKSNRLLVEFEFDTLAEKDAKRYRFRHEVKRRKSNYEDVYRSQRQSYRWEEGEWIPLEGEEGEAEHILGLSYDNFRRTIIIPQGKFEEFIALPSGQRSKMLEELFGLGKYDLAGRTKALSRRTATQIETHQALHQQYAQVTPEAIAENEAEIAAKNQAYQVLLGELEQLRKQREGLEQLQELSERLQTQQKQREELEGRKPAIEQRRQRLQRYLSAMDRFGIDLNEHQRLGRELKETEKELQEKRETRRRVAQSLEKQKQRFVEVEQLYQQRDELQRKAEELEKLIGLKEVWSVVGSLEKRVQDGQEKVRTAEARIAKFEQEQAELEQSIEALEKQRPDTDELLAISTWFAERRRLTDKLAEREKHRQQLDQEVVEGKETKQQLAKAAGIDLRRYDLSTQKLIEQLQGQKQELETERTRAEAARQQLQVQQQLQALAGDLQPGDPCPLCGATDHPQVARQQQEDEALKARTAEVARLDQRQESLQQILYQLDTLFANAKKLAKELKAAEIASQETRGQLDLHLTHFIWQGYDDADEAGVKKRLEAGQALQQQLQAQQQQLKGRRESLREEQQRREHYRQVLDGLRQDLSSQRSKFDTGKAALQFVSYPEWAPKDNQAVHDEIARLRRDYTSLADLHGQLREAIEEQNKHLHNLSGVISSLEGEERKYAIALAQLNQRLNQRLEKAEFDSLEEVRQTLDLALSIDQEKEDIRVFEQRLTECETTLRDLQTQMGDRQFDHEAFALLQGDIADKEAQQGELTQEIGGLKRKDEELRKDLTEKKQLAKKLQALEARAENLKLLEGLFRGSGFVNYVSTVYLENLCAAANARFLKLTGNALSLEVDENNNFQVRDLLNGGRRRSVKTLSGGQTFQAALCLALALSDQVQRQASARQNFFFLDEGFGSQDKGSLRIIFQTLKSLRKENRIVG
jgi:DNA repair protein SbcC/Rad50